MGARGGEKRRVMGAGGAALVHMGVFVTCTQGVASLWGKGPQMWLCSLLCSRIEGYKRGLLGQGG